MVGSVCEFVVCKFLGTDSQPRQGSIIILSDISNIGETAQGNIPDVQIRECVQSRHTCTHNPLAVITSSYALTGFFEFEVLQEFDATRIFGVILETPLALPGEPFG